MPFYAATGSISGQAGATDGGRVWDPPLQMLTWLRGT